MRSIKKPGVILIVAILFLNGICCYAGEIAESSVKASAIISPYWAYMDAGESVLINKGSGEVLASGTTYGYSKCDEVGVTTYLQQLNSEGQWVTIKEQTYIIRNNSYISGGFTAWVETYRSYRVTSYHWVKKGATFESVWSYTPTFIVGP